MAIVSVSGTDRRYERAEEITGFLARYGIWYRRFDGVERLAAAGAEKILEAFDEPIRQLKAEGGYRTADVIDVSRDTPNLDAMLAKFSREHWHDEDEVRFIVRGRGVFHVNPGDDPVFKIQVEAGDMINVPRGTRHWFDLCAEARIVCVRLFQDASGWTPHYTDSGVDARHQPLCFGPAHIPPGRVAS
jgi:1,2-dihydroxy-3-keto-5-methylthiopentene dioxygenase